MNQLPDAHRCCPTQKHTRRLCNYKSAVECVQIRVLTQPAFVCRLSETSAHSDCQQLRRSLAYANKMQICQLAIYGWHAVLLRSRVNINASICWAICCFSCARCEYSLLPKHLSHFNTKMLVQWRLGAHAFQPARHDGTMVELRCWDDNFATALAPKVRGSITKWNGWMCQYNNKCNHTTSKWWV